MTIPVPPVDADLFLEELASLSVDRQVQRMRTAGDVNCIMPALAEHIEAISISDLARADRASETMVRLADVSGTVATKARVYRTRGHVLAYCNRYDEALLVLKSAAALAESASQPVEAARARLAMLHAYARLARYDEAIIVGEIAFSAFTLAGETMLAAKAQINLGVTHRMRDDPVTALAMFDRARPTLAAGLAINPVMLAQLDSNRAEAMLDLNRFTDAEQTFSAALSIFEQHGVRRAAAIVEGNLADMMSRQGRLERALYHFEKARRHLEIDAAPGDLARLTAEQAEAMAAVGLYDEAMTNYEQAIPVLRERGLVWEAARAGMGLGRTLLRLGRRATAAPALEEAAAAFRQLGHNTGLGRISLLQGELALALGDGEQSRQCLSEALNLLEHRPADFAVAQALLASVELDAGKLDDAGRLLVVALESATRLNLAPLQADLLHARGRLHRTQGLNDAALQDFRQAADQIERLRGALQAERYRAAFLGNRLAIYEDLVEALLAHAGPDAIAEAFSVIERAKNRSLLDQVAGAIDVALEPVARQADDQEDRLLAELIRHTGELNALYRRLDDMSPEDRRRSLQPDWQQHIASRERQIEMLEGRLAATRGIGGLFARATDLPSVQRLLQPGWALIEFFIYHGQVMAMVIRNDKVRAVQNMADLATLEDSLERLQFQIARSVSRTSAGAGLSGSGPGSGIAADNPKLLRGVQRELATLFDLLIAPLKPALDSCHRLLIVPHGPLHVLPFQALWNGDRYLIHDYEIVYWPSASVFTHLADRPRPSTAENDTSAPLVVGVPDDAAPHIEEEAQTIAGVLRGSRLLVGAQATTTEFATLASTAPILHLACHGRFRASSPLSSGLKFADRWLTVRDLYKLRLRHPLVVLSGCDTGLADIRAADEMVSLLRGFFAAGASSVISTQWALHDRTAAKMMASLYNMWYNMKLRNGSDLAGTMRSIQCQTIETQPHPAYWAPFILVGNP